jgi:16S rRNA (guanine966-N2)-methyltransferase
LRIIAGEFRGRKLLAPEGDVTRPITDRVKQSLFDILSPRIEGARVYDLFAGTGSMGLECLSRGAMGATFFEADRSAAVRLRKNIVVLGLAERSRVVAGDLFKWFEKAPPDAGAVELIFLDPPYRFLKERPEDLKQLGQRLSAMLADEGIVTFRHAAEDELVLPGLSCRDRREYGGMTIEFLAR